MSGRRNAKTSNIYLRIILTGWQIPSNKTSIKSAGKEVKVTVKIAVGAPEQSICDLVNNNKIDLIIMASVSSSGLKIGKTLGSVVDHICHTVPVPVMLIRPRRAQLPGNGCFLIIFCCRWMVPPQQTGLARCGRNCRGLQIPVMLFEMAVLSYPSTTGSYLNGSEYVKINERDEQVIESNYAAANEAEESGVLAELMTDRETIKSRRGIVVDHRITSGARCRQRNHPHM